MILDTIRNNLKVQDGTQVLGETETLVDAAIETPRIRDQVLVTELRAFGDSDGNQTGGATSNE